jgi:hypothetical protein
MSSGRKASPEIEFSTAGISYAQPHLQLCVHDHVRGGKHVRGAAHVLLHDQHRAIGLDVEPAGIEAHALADQRDLRMYSRIAPGEIDQARARAARRGRPRGSAGSSA